MLEISLLSVHAMYCIDWLVPSNLKQYIIHTQCNNNTGQTSNEKEHIWCINDEMKRLH